MKQLPLIFSFALLLSACGPSVYKRKQSLSDAFIETLSTERFKNLLAQGDGLLLDVRTPEEVAAGHIAKALAINVNDSILFTKSIQGLPRDKDVYVYCRSGKRSLKAAAILQENGFKRIYNLEQGITGWIDEGLPVIKP